MGNAAGKWFESATGMDLDDALAYQTPKIVMIRDRTLGLLHYSFLAAILFYIIGFVMIMEKGYLEGDYPVAATRSTLREPGPTAVDFCGQTLLRQSFDDLDYCAQGKPDCEYCRDCIYSDWRGVVYPPELRDAMFITTRITTTEEELVCDPVADIECFEPYQETSNEVVFVVRCEGSGGSGGGCEVLTTTPTQANIEDYTIGLFHSVRAANFFEEKVRDGNWDFEGTGNSVYKQLDTAGSNRYLKGRLSDLKGNTVCEFPSDDLDVIPVAALLAAGSLDDLDSGFGEGWVGGWVGTGRRLTLCVPQTHPISPRKTPTASGTRAWSSPSASTTLTAGPATTRSGTRTARCACPASTTRSRRSSRPRPAAGCSTGTAS